MKKYILTLDEGTTSARAILYDRKCDAVSMAQHEFTQIYPKPGMVEHDPKEILSAQYSAATEAIIMAGIRPDEIAAVGITNQRETTIIWDRETGEPVYNAIVWQCRRTADICEELTKAGLGDYISSVTGLKIDAYFSATKIKWILDNVPLAREKAKSGRLLFGTVDTWLLWKLSGGKIHATDYTNASRTMLFDIHNLCWDKKLLRELDIPECMLPVVYPSSHTFGNIDIMGYSLPVCCMVGDQQAAMFGQKCFSEGDIKNTYGTGCFLLMNTGSEPYRSKSGLVSTVAATLEGEKPQYALEGSVFIGGAIIQWLRDELKIIENAPMSEECANRLSDNGGVYIVPAFAGLGAPYWDMYARGTIFGLSRGSGRDVIVRAALESIAYQTDDLLSAACKDTGITPRVLKADGGASNNRFLMQFQSDISHIEVIKPENPESTALGAAMLTGLCCGFFVSKSVFENSGTKDIHYSPKMSFETRTRLLDGWHRAVNSTIKFTSED